MGHGQAQGTRTRSGDTDTLKGHGHAQGTRSRSVHTDKLKGLGHAQVTRTGSRSRHSAVNVTVTARYGHDHGTVETRKSCKLGIITVL